MTREQMIERTVAELTKRIVANHFEETKVTMKCNGDVVSIAPCSYLPKITDMKQCDWFLFYSPSVNLSGDSKIETIAKYLVDYEKLIKESNDDVEQLKAHIRKYGERSDWDFVSDFHKDLFGHRPHVSIAQQIAWANSNSTDSARYFVA